MRALSDAEFLGLWERGRRFDPLDQSLLAVAVAFPEVSFESLADWPLGRLNQALAKVRYACFGKVLQGWTACPKCGEKLEFEMDGTFLVGDDSMTSSAEPIVVHGRSYRLPTSRDLARIARETDPHLAVIRLLEACFVGQGDIPTWTDNEIEEVGETMARADPLAESRLTLNCTECAFEWNEPLNISTFLWAEIDSRARKVLNDAHTLASAYGWSEKEIFSLSESRRALYVEMVLQ